MGSFGLKGFTKTLLLVFFCFLLLMNFSTVIKAAASDDEGYWKLVKVERKLDGLKEKRDGHIEETGFKSKFIFDYKSEPGHIERKMVFYEFGDLVQRQAAYVKWAQPPKKFKPGEKWDWKFKAEITEDYVSPKRGKVFGAWSGVYMLYTVSDSISGPDTYFGSEITIGKSTGKSTYNQSLIEFPQKSEEYIKSHKYLNIVIRATVLGYNRGEDCYIYRYEWVDGKPKEIKGNLVLNVKHNYGGSVGKLKVNIKNLDTNKTHELNTDDNGQIKQQFTATTTSEYIRIKIESYQIGAKTFYTMPMEDKKPSYIRNTINYKVDKEIHVMDKEKDFSTNSTINLPLIEAIMLPFKWDYDKNEWVSCNATILAGPKKKPRIFMALKKDMKKGKDGSYFVKMYFPCSNILKTRRLSLLAYDPADKIKDLKFLNIALSDRRPVNIITFNLCDVCMMIARIKQKIQDYFTPIVGEELARKIANVKFVFSPKVKGANYLDGVITVPEDFDLTSDQACDTITHEWGHRIMEILADDPGVEDNVGLPHELWSASPNKETAWDEGRAHFLGILLSK